MTSVEERRAEAGEVLGLQRLYVTTALSNQPRGEMSRPPEVRQIPTVSSSAAHIVVPLALV